jgi:hypothetical protein
VLASIAAATPASPAVAYELVFSTSPTRSAPVPLAGATVSGKIYAFVTPDTGASGVRFWLDDPQMSGAPRQTENNPPYDFAGGTVATANAFDTGTIAAGAHTITAAVALAPGGTSVVNATFTVAGGATPALLWSPDPVAVTVPEGGSATAHANLNTSSGTVQFTVSDDAPWLSPAPASGSTPATIALSVNASGLAPGTYTGTVSATASGYLADALTVQLTVGQPPPPDQVHLAWVTDPSTTLTIVWRTLDAGAPSVAQYRAQGTTSWQTATGAPRTSGTTGALHEVTVTGLLASTSYEYRVSGPASTWSPIFRTRTAPPPGPASFDAVYVADTGLVGRTDGLATGTQQVVDEIAALDPLLVLPGGDYVYFDTDKRFGSLDATIDAWFNQMQPVASRSPLMPTYGNHEVLLGEGFAPWAARFPTPSGFNNRQNYSFDVGDVHFVSIMAVSDTGGLSSGVLQWIEQDITAAWSAGQRWVVPYFHVSPFADGKNHTSNLNLRAQLGPLFERLGVKLVISSHDQAYERTYPLVGVPTAITRTSDSKRCYTGADGVTWVKVSPGGKLSNKNAGFSQFATQPPPSWTAVRDNTMHHFARLVVSATGTIRLDAYGVIGDGTPPVVLDSFEYTLGSCPPELRFSLDAVSLTAAVGGSASTAVTLSGSDGAASYTVSADAPWLSVTPGTGSTPATLTVAAQAAGLAAGTYAASVSAAAPGHIGATLPVTLTVGATHALRISTVSTRASAVPLEGATVAGDIYAFVDPATSVRRVRFFVDDPQMTGAPRQTENNAPWDLAGTASNGTALPFDTAQLPDGPHTVTAAVERDTGATEVLQATFTVDNGGSGSGATLLVSTAPDRSNAAALDGAALDGDVYVFVAPASGIRRVRFFVDDPQMTSAPRQTENLAPWDLAGTASNGTALPFDTAQLAGGPHTVTAAVDLTSGATEVISGTFTVGATAASGSGPRAERVRTAALVER